MSLFVCEQGDKLFLDPHTYDRTEHLQLQSSVASRLASLYNGSAWFRFLKRKELVCWKAYNLRTQVQQIVLLDKADKRKPLTKIAEDLHPDDIIYRSARREGERPTSEDDGDSNDGARRSGDMPANQGDDSQSLEDAQSDTSEDSLDLEEGPGMTTPIAT